MDFQAARLLCPGILQTRILEWVAVPSSRGSSQPRDTTLLSLMSPTLAGGFFTTSPAGSVGLEKSRVEKYPKGRRNPEKKGGG